MSKESPSPRLGLALGGGSARGWAHIGVLKALTEHGIEPDILCGTSVGAMVGGIYAAGKLHDFENWIVHLTRRNVFSLLDFTVSGGGPIAGRRLIDLYRERIGDPDIEDLPGRFAAVATDLYTGSEVWLQEGSLLTAIRASISIPGVFTPVLVRGRWLVDGGLVNPVPVSLCRALGADLVIAVDLSQGLLDRTYRLPDAEVKSAVVRDRRGSVGGKRAAEVDAPSLSWVVTTASYIMQDRISRSRLAGDPPDLLLAPRVSHVPWMEFTGGQPTIEEGYQVVQRNLQAIDDLLDPGRSR